MGEQDSVVQSIVAQLLGEAPRRPVVRVEAPRLPDITLLLGPDRVQIQTEYNAAHLPDLRKLPGRKYVSGPINHASVSAAVLEFAAKWGLTVAPDAEEACLLAAEGEAVARQAEEVLTAASTATWVPEDVSVHIALAQYLYDFQKAGAAYALNALRTWIGDQMGLGKTRQALAVIATLERYPVLWICKASLKTNIYVELSGHYPDGTVALNAEGDPMDVLVEDAEAIEILDGINAYPINPDAKHVIVNYDILAVWAEKLVDHNFRAIIVDEAHLFANPDSQRTKAATSIIEDLYKREGVDTAVVLFLTGTEMVNRPSELINQLILMRRLEEIAPTPWKANGPNGTFTQEDYIWSFKFRYCRPVKEKYGWKFTGASNTAELNRKLRQTCMVRRLRRECTELRDTKREKVLIDISAADYKIYSAAQDAMDELLREGADGGEILAQLTRLRQVAGLAKVGASIEWVQDWLDSNEGEKIIIFAHHKEVQTRLWDAFPGPRIYAGQKSADLDAAKIEFMQGEARTIVVSMAAGSMGHNLTAAHNVAFVEYDWTPTGMDQGADRANRIGQRTDVDVVAWHLHGVGIEMDDHMASVNEDKRKMFDEVIDGVRPEVDEAVEIEGAKAAVLRKMRERIEAQKAVA